MSETTADETLIMSSSGRKLNMDNLVDLVSGVDFHPSKLSLSNQSQDSDNNLHTYACLSADKFSDFSCHLPHLFSEETNQQDISSTLN